jgi:hypothetical protein
VAAKLFAAAISQFQAIGHPAEAARVDAERSRPPTARRDDPEPAERWALRRQ